MPESVDPVPERPAPAGLMRIPYLLLGFVMVALAVIGAILPVMPTTIFVILAAWCFGKSSPRFEGWLLNHRQFGPTLRAWRAEGAISRKGKMFASGGMVFGYAMFLWGARPHWPLALLVGAGMAACAAYVLSRPAPSV